MLGKHTASHMNLLSCFVYTAALFHEYIQWISSLSAAAAAAAAAPIRSAN